MSEVVLVERAPSVDDYRALRVAVGCGATEVAATARSIRNTLFWVVLLAGEEVIGCGRVIGDDGLCYYVQDVIVMPAYQGRGYGRRLMERIMHYLETHLTAGAFAGLMAAKGAQDFYRPYGFVERPSERYGPGMIRYW